MNSLRTIRKRLHAVENIQQITTAMEMVASARLKRMQLKIEQESAYANKLREILRKLSLANTDFVHPLLMQRAVERIGLVVVSSDKGLCGSYNHNVFTTVDRFLKKHTDKLVELIAIGHKAVSYYQNGSLIVKNHDLPWSSRSNIPQLELLIQYLTEWFINGDLDEIWVVYSPFVHLQSQKVICEKFLPIEKTEKSVNERIPDYIFEPSAEEIYSRILRRYCITRMQSIFDGAYAAELVARMLSMKAASKNAGEMIEHLTLLRNKVRQTSITREILEIVSGTVEN